MTSVVKKTFLRSLTVSGATLWRTDVEDSSQVGMAKEIDISNLVLCKKHKPGSMVPLSCTTCAAAIGLFKDKAVIENMVLNSKASSSS